MRNRHVKAALVLLLALSGMSLTGGAGRLFLTAGAFLGGNAQAASASGMSITAAAPPTSQPAGAGFTYQGKLLDNGQPVDGQYDFAFLLFDQAEGGTQIGSSVEQQDQTVTGGLFTAVLNFGAGVLQGDARWLEIRVRPTGSGEYVILGPRQPITPAPYALYSYNTRHPQNVVTVAPAGGDFTSIQAAINSITDNSATNRYVVKVAPGTYTEKVTMRPYVDIEGSGEDNTIITSSGSPAVNSSTTMVTAYDTELRFLTIRNTGGSYFVEALSNLGNAVSFLQVTITASGAIVEATGVRNHSNSLTMTDVTITASGQASNLVGFASPYGSFDLDNVTITASGGQVTARALNSGSRGTVRNSILSANGAVRSVGAYFGNYAYPGVSILIEDSTIAGPTNTIVAEGGQSAAVRVGASKLEGGPVSSPFSGDLKCAGVYDENYTFYPSTCP